MEMTSWRLVLPHGTGRYWICGNEVWKILPIDKDRPCALGSVTPNITFDHIEDLNGRMGRMKISINPLIECLALFHSVIRALIPSLGIVELERAVVNISTIIEHIERQTTDTVSALQEEEIRDLSHMVLQNRMDLNFLLAAQGVCAIINTTYCFYVDQSRRIKKDLAEIQKHTQIFHEVALRNNTLNFISSTPSLHGYQTGPG
ncbi:hypothetical protein Nmel_003641 [Mimus melanotis]